MTAAQLASPSDMSSFEAGWLWSGLLRVPMMAGYSWTAVETLRSHGMARRRMALGLGDPVVASGFLLWGIVGVSQMFVHSALLVLHFQGMGMLQSPVGLFVVAAGGAVGSVLMFLAFVTPKAYQDFLRGRAAVASI
jgi:hypothetical protein